MNLRASTRPLFLLAVITVCTTMLRASAISGDIPFAETSFGSFSSASQVTLAASSQAVTFTGTTTGVNVTFSTLSGLALFGSDLGQYMMTLTGDPISLVTSNPPVSGLYDMASGGGALSLTFTDPTNPGTFSGVWNLETLSGGTTRIPVFIGSLLVTSGTNQFHGWVGTTLRGDFTVNLNSNQTVSQVFQAVGTQTAGGVSSGELVPISEPGTLSLVGSGVLLLARLVRQLAPAKSKTDEARPDDGKENR